MTSWGTVSVSGRTLLHRISYTRITAIFGDRKHQLLLNWEAEGHKGGKIRSQRPRRARHPALSAVKSKPRKRSSGRWQFTATLLTLTWARNRVCSGDSYREGHLHAQEFQVIPACKVTARTCSHLRMTHKYRQPTVKLREMSVFIYCLHLKTKKETAFESRHTQTVAVLSVMSFSLFPFSNLHQREPPNWLFVLSAMQNWHVNSADIYIRVAAGERGGGGMTSVPKWHGLVRNTLTDERRYVRGCDQKAK